MVGGDAMDGAAHDDVRRWTTWVGRTETNTEWLAPAPASAAAAMLDERDGDGDGGRDDRGLTPERPAALPTPPAELPPLWHWFHFLPHAPQGALGEDGHPPRGGFLPPIPYPRRMFAGARLRFVRPLALGRPATREGTVRDVAVKHGRSGALAFVTVGYRYVQDGALCVEEEQDIVYREPGPPIAAPVAIELPPPPAGAWTRTLVPDSRLLFRFSALTFNAHRIHYDRPYARDVEGYPGLVVHGPLTALLLCELARARSGRPVAAFAFRGEAPLFDLGPVRLVGVPDGDVVALEAQGPDGRTALRATATLG